MERISFHKSIEQVEPLSWLWIVGAIFGHPFYNMLAYLICTGQDWYTDTGTNTVQVYPDAFILILLLIFLLRFTYHRWRVSKTYKMNLWFNLEVFAQRKAYQTLGLLTFLMWVGEVEGNIAGFIYFPLTILLGIPIGIINRKRLNTLPEYLSTKY